MQYAYTKDYNTPYSFVDRTGDILDIYKKETEINEYSFIIKNGDETIIKAKLEYGE